MVTATGTACRAGKRTANIGLRWQGLTAAEQGATLLNYAPVTGFSRDADGFLDGVAGFLFLKQFTDQIITIGLGFGELLFQLRNRRLQILGLGALTLVGVFMGFQGVRNDERAASWARYGMIANGLVLLAIAALEIKSRM